MSKSSNMLRTRRRDNNVKPNRRDSRLTRLDRKSSRGMIYENEELRLKTININAEIERGQSDIKKLKRENEMLKKEIWCLRDEYDKLDRLVKEKKIDFSSSTTGSSDSESCSSCSDESNEVETTQNLENVQKTNLENIHRQFDHLSVVAEESTENSDKNSIRTSVPNDEWNLEKDVIKPDQSYPLYQAINKTPTLPLKDRIPKNFFSPIKINKNINNYSSNQENDVIHPNEYYQNSVENDYQHQNIECPHYVSEKIVSTEGNVDHIYQNMIMLHETRHPNLAELNTLDKTATDLMVKMDNHNFDSRQLVFNNYNTLSQSSTFSNSGNLDELLNEIESISQQNYDPSENNQMSTQGQAPSSPSQLMQPDYLTQLQGKDFAFYRNSGIENLIADTHHQLYLQQQHHQQNNGIESDTNKPYKSELNVVLMPNPMPLIGFDKYKSIQRSFESLHSRSLENMSASQHNLSSVTNTIPIQQSGTVGNVCIISPTEQQQIDNRPVITVTPEPDNHERNPFFFNRLKDNYVNAEYFNMRYNLENLAPNQIEEEKKQTVLSSPNVQSPVKLNVNPVDNNQHAEQTHSENEENLKFQTSNKLEGSTKSVVDTPNPSDEKKSKLSIRRKVSIHFKGKKDKSKKSDNPMNVAVDKLKTSQIDKKHSIFDIKHKVSHQKTPSLDSRKSTTETSNVETKTSATSSDSKASNCDKKNVNATSSEKKETASSSEKKNQQNRKSVSVSPDRNKHVHVREEGSSKKHKKHKRADKPRNRRGTVNSLETRHLRERSYSVCTDRSNILLDNRPGYGSGYGMGSSFLYDDYSDRERTNSVSSCDTNNTIAHRKMSGISNFQLNEKVPWCGCWGNGCL